MYVLLCVFVDNGFYVHVIVQTYIVVDMNMDAQVSDQLQAQT